MILQVGIPLEIPKNLPNFQRPTAKFVGTTPPRSMQDPKLPMPLYQGTFDMPKKNLLRSIEMYLST